MPEIHIKNYIFKPSFIPSIVTCLLLILMLWLGNWQLERAEYKANLQSIIESRQTIEPTPLSTLASKQKDDWLYHPAIVTGTYDTEHQIYFDNQVHNMTAGFSIFTPLKISETTGILVNRGWVALGKSRANLPDINLVENERLSITGLLTLPPSKGMVLSNTANNYSQWPALLQYINIAEIEKSLDYKLLPMVFVMNTAEQTAFDIMPVKINMRGEKHTAYAVQWFALSLTLLIIYIVVNTKNTLKKK